MTAQAKCWWNINTVSLFTSNLQTSKHRVSVVRVTWKLVFKKIQTKSLKGTLLYENCTYNKWENSLILLEVLSFHSYIELFTENIVPVTINNQSKSRTMRNESSSSLNWRVLYRITSELFWGQNCMKSSFSIFVLVEVRTYIRSLKFIELLRFFFVVLRMFNFKRHS